MQLTDIVELVVRRGVERHVRKTAGVMLPLSVGMTLPGIAERAVERARSTERALNEGSDKTASSFPGLSAALAQMSGKGPSNAGNMVNFGRFNPGNAIKPSSQMSAGFGSKMPDAHGLGAMAGEGVMGGLSSLLGSPVEGVSKGVSGGLSEMIKRKMVGQDFGERKDPLHMAGSQAIQTFGKGISEMGVDLLRDMAAKAMSAVGHAGDDSARQAILGDLKRNDPVLSSADDKTLMEAYHTMTRFAPVLSTDKNAVRSFLRQAVMSGSGPDYASIKLLADSERAVTGERT